MSSKQLKKLILIVVSLVIVIGGAFALLFFFDTDSGGEDDEAAKIAGGYEIMKSDLVSTLKIRDSQAATIANIFFDDIGISKYETMNMGGSRGNLTVYCDGYQFDAFVQAGEFANAYIGNALVYKNPKVSSVTVSTALEYTYKQYTTLVEAFGRALKIDEDVAKDLYSELTMMGINSFSNAKAGKLNGIKGFYGYEGNFKYFLTLNEDNSIHVIYVVCDGFEPIEVYNSATGEGQYKLSNVKITMGARQGVANILAFKVKQATELEVVFPAALLSGDDSWLMVKKDDTIYIEVAGEVTEKDKTKVKDFVIKLTDPDRDLIYLKIDKKVYVE